MENIPLISSGRGRGRGRARSRRAVRGERAVASRGPRGTGVADDRISTGVIDEQGNEKLPQDSPMETPVSPPKRRRVSKTPRGRKSSSGCTRGPSKVLPGSSSVNNDQNLWQLPDAMDDVGLGSEESGEEDELSFIPRSQMCLLQEDPAEFLQPPSQFTPAAEDVQPSLVGDLLTNDLFAFEWRDLPNPPLPPTERRENFSDSVCGPTASFSSPYDAFIAIWTPQFMEHIVDETNRYAQQVVQKQLLDGTLTPHSRMIRWQPTAIDELYVFFALLIATGLCVKGSLKEYWSAHGLLATPNFGRHLSINRFNILSRCIHFVNNLTMPAGMTRTQAKVHKIQPVLDHLNDKFQTLYVMGRNISLDEPLAQKRMSNMKQNIRNRMAKAGVKSYEVSESHTGYLWRMEFHAGQEDPAEICLDALMPLTSASQKVVLEMLKGLENTGRTVWMDNHYNSPTLARVLKNRGFDCAGPMKLNRQGVPLQLLQLDSASMTLGEIRGATSGDVDVIVWRDHNCVAPFVSTYHGATVHRDKYGVVKPNVMSDYNACMCGVDKKERMLSAFPMERSRTTVWYKKIFKGLLNVSVLNAFILYRCSDKRMSHRDFRKKLTDQLLQRHSNPANFSVPPVTLNPTGGIELSNDVLEHFPVVFPVVPGTSRRARRYCAVCRQRTTLHCRRCQVPLCVGPVDSCCVKYHRALK